jgi:hypothetical protein
VCLDVNDSAGNTLAITCPLPEGAGYVIFVLIIQRLTISIKGIHRRYRIQLIRVKTMVLVRCCAMLHRRLYHKRSIRTRLAMAMLHACFHRIILFLSTFMIVSNLSAQWI